MVSRLHQPGSPLENRLQNLIPRHEIDPALMGFPKDYKQRSIWQAVSQPEGT